MSFRGFLILFIAVGALAATFLILSRGRQPVEYVYQPAAPGSATPPTSSERSAAPNRASGGSTARGGFARSNRELSTRKATPPKVRTPAKSLHEPEALVAEYEENKGQMVGPAPQPFPEVRRTYGGKPIETGPDFPVLIVSSKPGKAEVWRNGELIGWTPYYEKLDTPPGAIRLTLKRPGFEDHEFSVSPNDRGDFVAARVLKPIIHPDFGHSSED